ncbi:unnamed protein product [Rotaria sp. Silwood1]|nr:unnamed protein product [Rotaria sp. Silwood1]CAF0970965.1 unnamed protein product [Rotaria sp. Silwood1]CAF0980212.1 unnamed protein product [Rotaria sp. Silwood1]CAF3382974.1 unnamed protein product [Rotaria sp. Silwood1]CAF3409951.1 unnamed protein product [Rotaria sp. Silwood1]
MATAISSFTPFAFNQQSYYYPTLPSTFSLSAFPNNFYFPQQHQMQPQQQQQQFTTPVQYVDSGIQSLRPRRQPRIYREVIRLPTPEPTYRQVRYRLPTPERQVIQRTVVQRGNGEVVVREQRPQRKPRSHSRIEYRTQKRSHHSRQVHTD